MADPRLRPGTQVGTGAGTREMDQGLRSYMLGVYNYVSLGVAATAIITLFVAGNPALMAMAVSLRWVGCRRRGLCVQR